MKVGGEESVKGKLVFSHVSVAKNPDVRRASSWAFISF